MHLTIPGLYSPFPSRINTHIDKVALKTAEWVQHFQLHTGQAYEQYLSENLSYMTARFYPTANYQQLLVSDRFNTLLFAMDDAMDHNINPDDIISSRIKFIAFITQCIQIMEGVEKPVQKIGVLAALEDVWESVKAISSTTWQQGFIINIKKMFQAAKWAYDNAVVRRIPGIQEFYQVRPFLGAAHISTDLIAITEQIYLPDHIMMHPLIVELTRLCQISVCLANDLFSYGKEEIHGDNNNMVSVIRAEKRIDVNRATIETVKMHDEDVGRFLSLQNELPDFGAHQNEVNRYLAILSSLMVGNIDWSLNESGRYKFSYEQKNVESNVRMTADNH